MRQADGETMRSPQFPKAAAPTAHHVHSDDADLVSLAYETICGLADHVSAIEDYARAIELIAASKLADGSCLSAALARLSEDIITRVDAVEVGRSKLFHALHPRRHEPGFDTFGKVGEIGERHD